MFMSAGAEDGLPDLMGHLPSVCPFLILPIGSHAQPLWTLVLENLLETSGFVCSRRSPPGLDTVDTGGKEEGGMNWDIRIDIYTYI